MVNQMVKVSVVIPVYNVEQYLERCLDSIINQTLNDIEIICVNDGSTDKSLEILEKYASNDSRIKILSQENGGHAVATNNGINLATGEYLFLMDSDDILKIDALEKTYNVAKEKDVDFVLFKAINYDDAKQEYYENEFYSMNKIANTVGDNIFNYHDLGKRVFNVVVAPWTKLYNMNFIKDIGVKFPEGLIFDDNVFFWEVMLSAEKVYFLKEHLFYRRWYENSSTRAGDKRFIDSLIINSMIIDLFDEFGELKGVYKEVLFNRKVSLAEKRFTQINEEFKELYFDEMQKNFFNWIQNDENLYSINKTLTQRNRNILKAILTSKNVEEFKLLIKDIKLSSQRVFDDDDERSGLDIIDELFTHNYELKEENKRLNENLLKSRNKNTEIRTSKSWILTSPLRKAKEF